MTVPKAQTKIFISYRRSGEFGFVRLLTERLSSVYGKENVFRDISGLRSGEEFGKRIVSKLSEASVVIAVIGNDWVGRRRFRKPRIRSDGDWVHREIAHALASDKPVIPVLVGDVRLPTPGQLPASLRGLLSVHAARVRDESWEEDSSRLITAIDGAAQGSPGEGDADSYVWRRVEVGERGPGLVIPALVITLGLLVVAALWFYFNPNPGSVNLEDPSTWTPPKPSESRSLVAHFALRNALGEMQTSTGELNSKNAGDNVKKFMERFGAEVENAPWSGAFVTWCYLEALKRARNSRVAKLPFEDSAVNMRVAASLRQRGWLIEPFEAAEALPGDIIFFRRSHAPIGHAEIVYAVSSGKVCSIGGNVGNQVSGQCRPIGDDSIIALAAIPAQAYEQGPQAVR